MHYGLDKPAKLVYFNTCFDSIRTIPSLIHSETKPEDVDSDGEDHAADTTRYLLMSLHERQTPKPLNETQKKLEALKKATSKEPWKLYNAWRTVIYLNRSVSKKAHFLSTKKLTGKRNHKVEYSRLPLNPFS